MATLTELNIQLSDAQKAYHNIQTTGQVVKVRDQNGEEVEYSRININNLSKYISELKRQIAELQGVANNSYRPIGTYF